MRLMDLIKHILIGWQSNYLFPSSPLSTSERGLSLSDHLQIFINRRSAQITNPREFAYIHLLRYIGGIVLIEIAGISSLFVGLRPTCRPFALAFAIPLFTLARIYRERRKIACVSRNLMFCRQKSPPPLFRAAGVNLRQKTGYSPIFSTYSSKHQPFCVMTAAASWPT